MQIFITKTDRFKQNCIVNLVIYNHCYQLLFILYPIKLHNVSSQEYDSGFAFDFAFWYEDFPFEIFFGF